MPMMDEVAGVVVEMVAKLPSGVVDLVVNEHGRAEGGWRVTLPPIVPTTLCQPP